MPNQCKHCGKAIKANYFICYTCMRQVCIEKGTWNEPDAELKDAVTKLAKKKAVLRQI